MVARVTVNYPEFRQKLKTGSYGNMPWGWMMDRMEQTYATRLEKSGRILIPAPIRRRLGLSEGSQVIVKVEPSGAIEITSRSQALAKAREEIRKYIPDGRELADELIEDRRKEVEQEERPASSS
jgi:AbrB family looped-hinge helix DNA binding protein